MDLPNSANMDFGSVQGGNASASYGSEDLDLEITMPTLMVAGERHARTRVPGVVLRALGRQSVLWGHNPVIGSAESK